jgi:hypothetical protein
MKTIRLVAIQPAIVSQQTPLGDAKDHPPSQQ